MDTYLFYLYTFSLLLIVFGYLISIYFFKYSKGKIPSKVSWLPSIVQIGDCRCDEIINTRFGRSFGRSNAYWAMWYFVLLFALVMCQWIADWPGVIPIFFITLLALARSIYLAWALVVLKVMCRPCITAHMINFLLLLIFGSLVWPELIL